MLIFEDARGLELSSTLDCGQCFRWLPRQEGWQGVVGGRSVLARTQGRALILEGAQEEDRDFWADYFALDLDYPALQSRFCAGNRRLRLCVEENPGIRVLRQPFFETLCTFLISQNNNISRIRAIVERLCVLAGQPVAYGRFSFPQAARLAEFSAQDLAPLRAGWRAAYLAEAARQVASGQICEAELRALPLAQARQRLQSLKGVGPKVADCVLLFGLGRWDAFPRDVWINRAMDTLFPRGVPVCCRGRSGIAQQYIFAYARAHLPRGGEKGEKAGKKKSD